MSAAASSACRQVANSDIKRNLSPSSLGNFLEGESGEYTSYAAMLNTFSYMEPEDLRRLSIASQKVTKMILDHPHKPIGSEHESSQEEPTFNNLVNMYGLEKSQVRQIPRFVPTLSDYISVVTSVGQYSPSKESSRATEETKALIEDLKRSEPQLKPTDLEKILFNEEKFFSSPESILKLRLILSHPQAWGIPVNSLEKYSSLLRSASYGQIDNSNFPMSLLLSLPLASHLTPERLERGSGSSQPGFDLSESLVEVAKKGDIVGLKIILGLPQAFNIPSGRDTPNSYPGSCGLIGAIFAAARINQSEMVSILLKRKKVKEIPTTGQGTIGSLLEILLKNGDVDNAKALLRFPQASQIPQNELKQAFVGVAKTNKLELAEVIFKRINSEEGARYQYSSSYNVQALVNAIENRQSQMIDFIMQHVPPKNLTSNDLTSLLSTIARAGDYQTLQALLAPEYGLKITVDMINTMATNARAECQHNFIRNIFSKWQASSFREEAIWEAIHSAVLVKDVVFLEKLLQLSQCQKAFQEGSRLPFPVQNLIKEAAVKGRVEILRSLMGAPCFCGISSDEISNFIHAAIRKDQNEVVQFLMTLPQGSQISPGEIGSMLTVASTSCGPEILKTLFALPQIRKIPHEPKISRNSWDRGESNNYSGIVTIVIDLMRRGYSEMAENMFSFDEFHKIETPGLAKMIASAIQLRQFDIAKKLCSLPGARNIPFDTRDEYDTKRSRKNIQQDETVISLEDILLKAVEKGDLGTVESLSSLLKLSNIQRSKYYGVELAFRKAVEAERIDIVQKLLFLPQITAQCVEGSIAIAVEKKSAQIVQLLQAHRGPIK